MKYSSEIEQAMRILYTSLSERDRRRYAAIEAAKLGHGGITYIASILGCSFKTICQGQSDLAVLSGGIVLKKRIPKALPPLISLNSPYTWSPECRSGNEFVDRVAGESQSN